MCWALYRAQKRKRLLFNHKKGSKGKYIPFSLPEQPPTALRRLSPAAFSRFAEYVRRPAANGRCKPCRASVVRHGWAVCRFPYGARRVATSEVPQRWEGAAARTCGACLPAFTSEQPCAVRAGCTLAYTLRGVSAEQGTCPARAWRRCGGTTRKVRQDAASRLAGLGVGTKNCRSSAARKKADGRRAADGGAGRVPPA